MLPDTFQTLIYSRKEIDSSRAKKLLSRIKKQQKDSRDSYPFGVLEFEGEWFFYEFTSIKPALLMIVHLDSEGSELHSSVWTVRNDTVEWDMTAKHLFVEEHSV